MIWPRGRTILLAGALGLGEMICSLSPVSAQELKLRGISPLAAWQLSPALGVNEDSLHRNADGVWFHDIHLGDGPWVSTGDSVGVHFVGFLANATKFTATDRKPFNFRLGTGHVIAGWDSGISGMRVGGRRQLVIPSHLGYGAKGDGKIPPDAVLVFDITLIEKY
jgi:hypothetical protein